MEFVFVGVGGFVGSCLRFLVTKFINIFTIPFPLATLISNVLAGFCIGLIAGLEQQSLFISPKTKLFLNVGLLGGLSTFSTFSLETINLFNEGKYLLCVGNVIFNLGFSLIGVLTGMFISKLKI